MSDAGDLKIKVESALYEAEKTMEPSTRTMLRAAYAASSGDLEQLLVCVGRMIDILGTARAVVRDLESQLLREPFAPIVLKPGKIEIEPAHKESR